MMNFSFLTQFTAVSFADEGNVVVFLFYFSVIITSINLGIQNWQNITAGIIAD